MKKLFFTVLTVVFMMAWIMASLVPAPAAGAATTTESPMVTIAGPTTSGQATEASVVFIFENTNTDALANAIITPAGADTATLTVFCHSGNSPFHLRL